MKLCRRRKRVRRLGLVGECESRYFAQIARFMECVWIWKEDRLRLRIVGNDDVGRGDVGNGDIRNGERIVRA